MGIYRYGADRELRLEPPSLNPGSDRMYRRALLETNHLLQLGTFSPYHLSSIYFRNGVCKTLLAADETRKRLRHFSLSPEHLLIALILNPDNPGCHLLLEAGVDTDVLRTELEWATINHSSAPPPIKRAVSSGMRAVILKSITEAHRLENFPVGPEHLLLGILAQGRSTASIILVEQFRNKRCKDNPLNMLRTLLFASIHPAR